MTFRVARRVLPSSLFLSSSFQLCKFKKERERERKRENTGNRARRFRRSVRHVHSSLSSPDGISMGDTSNWRDVIFKIHLLVRAFYWIFKTLRDDPESDLTPSRDEGGLVRDDTHINARFTLPLFFSLFHFNKSSWYLFKKNNGTRQDERLEQSLNSSRIRKPCGN